LEKGKNNHNRTELKGLLIFADSEAQIAGINKENSKKLLTPEVFMLLSAQLKPDVWTFGG